MLTASSPLSFVPGARRSVQPRSPRDLLPAHERLYVVRFIPFRAVLLIHLTSRQPNRSWSRADTVSASPASTPPVSPRHMPRLTLPSSGASSYVELSQRASPQSSPRTPPALRQPGGLDPRLLRVHEMLASPVLGSASPAATAAVRGSILSALAGMSSPRDDSGSVADSARSLLQAVQVLDKPAPVVESRPGLATAQASVEWDISGRSNELRAEPADVPTTPRGSAPAVSAQLFQSLLAQLRASPMDAPATGSPSASPAAPAPAAGVVSPRSEQRPSSRAWESMVNSM
jgi:hypothetical protein